MAEPTSFQQGPAVSAPMSFGYHTTPAFDVLEILPPIAQERLRNLRQRSHDQHALVVPFEFIREATAAKIEAGNRLARLQAPASEGGFNRAADDRIVLAAKANFDKAENDWHRLNERAESRAKIWQESSAALSNAEIWLRDARPANVLLTDHETELPKLAKGESSILDAIENRRRRAREIKAIIHRYQSAPFPSAHVKKKMREEIQALAMQGAPIVSNMVEHDLGIVWPTQQARSTIYNAPAGTIGVADVTATIPLIAWLLKDAMIAKLDAEIDSESDDGTSLSHEARQIKIAEAMGDLADVEYVESVLVFEAQRQNLPAEHRSDVSPACLLGIKFVTRASNGHDLPPTSIEHAYNIR